MSAHNDSQATLAPQTKGDLQTKRPIGAWGVFGALLIGFAIIAAGDFKPYTFLKGDSAFYITMQRALLDSGWLEMSRYHPMSWYDGQMPHYSHMDQAWSNLALGADGHTYYPKHPYLISLFALPLYALFGPTGSLAFNLIGMAALLTGGFLIARRFCGPGAAILGVLPLALSGLVLENLYTVSNDVFYSALLALGCAAVLARRDLVSALLLACAVVAKPTNILWLPAPFIAIGLRAWAEKAPANRRLRTLPDVRVLAAAMWKPALIVALIGGSAAVLNYVMFGNPAHTGYHSIIIVKGGEVQLDSAAAAFNQPFWSGLQAQLVDKWQGLWPRGAVLVVAAVFGVIGAVRAGPIALLPAIALLGYLGLYAKYDFIWARFYMPVAVLVPLGIAAPFARIQGRIAPLWLKTDRQLHVAVAALFGAGVVAVLAGFATSGPAQKHQLTDRLTQAKVERDDGRRTLKCDYLNPNTMHWECSRLEGQYWQGWGADIRGECAFTRRNDGTEIKGSVPGMYFVHPSPRPVVKRLKFDDLGPLSDFRLRLGYGKASRGTDARVTVTLNGRNIALPRMRTAGVLHSIGLADHVSPTGTNTLQIEVAADRTHDWRHFCIGADLSSP